jgi:hypothetical protein
LKNVIDLRAKMAWNSSSSHPDSALLRDHFWARSNQGSKGETNEGPRWAKIQGAALLAFRSVVGMNVPVSIDSATKKMTALCRRSRDLPDIQSNRISGVFDHFANVQT